MKFNGMCTGKVAAARLLLILLGLAGAACNPSVELRTVPVLTGIEATVDGKSTGLLTLYPPGSDDAAQPPELKVDVGQTLTIQNVRYQLVTLVGDRVPQAPRPRQSHLSGYPENRALLVPFDAANVQIRVQIRKAIGDAFFVSGWRGCGCWDTADAVASDWVVVTPDSGTILVPAKTWKLEHGWDDLLVEIWVRDQTVNGRFGMAVMRLVPSEIAARAQWNIRHNLENTWLRNYACGCPTTK